MLQLSKEVLWANVPHPLLLIFGEFGVLLGGIFGEKIDKKSRLFSMLFFQRFGEHFWWNFKCFLEPLGGQKSLRSRPRCDFLKSEKTSKSAIGSLRNRGSQVPNLMHK